MQCFFLKLIFLFIFVRSFSIALHRLKFSARCIVAICSALWNWATNKKSVRDLWNRMLNEEKFVCQQNLWVEIWTEIEQNKKKNEKKAYRWKQICSLHCTCSFSRTIGWNGNVSEQNCWCWSTLESTPYKIPCKEKYHSI